MKPEEKIERAYEELRSIIDGGSESFTHEDAVQYLKDKLAQPEHSCPECVFGVCHCKPLAQPKQECICSQGQCCRVCDPDVANGFEQPEQEPVAWGMMNDDGSIYDCICPEEHERVEGEYTIPLYTTPPQRTWVGLNDDDKKQIAKAANYNFEMTTGEYAERIGRLTEEKLKELNT